VKAPAPEDVAVFHDKAAFRDWLAANHVAAGEVWVGYYRKGAGKTAMTYPEAVEEGLCYGWIDGIGYRIDDEVHANRFTPRRKGSSWSARNIAAIADLTRAGRMHPAGLKAFEERDRSKDMPYMQENPLRQQLPPRLEARIKAEPAAWAYWQVQAPGYRRQAAFWVLSAKQEATRERRLKALIEDSAAERPIKPLSYGRNRK
jgi:uncharacterized protein YdeI (YjbR/CyaY-like superfamily)